MYVYISYIHVMHTYRTYTLNDCGDNAAMMRREVLAIQQQWRQCDSEHIEERVGDGDTLNREKKEKKMCFIKVHD